MKRDAIDMFKGIILLIVTSLLVMAYTTIERTVTTTTENKVQPAMTGVTPVSIGLMDKSKETTGPAKTSLHDNYVFVRNQWPVDGLKMDEESFTQTSITLLPL